MKRSTFKIVALCATLFFASCGAAPEPKSYNEGVNIIPVPASMQLGEGVFSLAKGTTLSAEGDEATTVANFFAQKMSLSTGYDIAVEVSGGDIELAIDPKMAGKAEGYALSVREDGVSVVGKDAAGLFYGMQTLLQLLPAEITSLKRVRGVEWVAPVVEIVDAPRFEYRGIMLDGCRHFLPLDFLKRQVDVLSMFKINRLHWHLTEDQAWRIEIKKYPKLTEVGSRRMDGEGTIHEGFYSQEDVKELVAYAAERQVTIVPEFELPGHELAAIAAYPELSCEGEAVLPRIVWGVEDIVMCPAKDFTFQFIEDVIDEMTQLFPGEYFHIGGDECPKRSWAECPACQALIKAEGLEAKDGHSAEERLQSYVIRRVEDMLTARGRRLIGWDEILEGGLSPNASVMSWRGESGGIAAARSGHDVVMTPNSAGYYLDHYQGGSGVEPVGIGGYSIISKTYSYDPIPAVVAQEGKSNHIKGVQGNLWSEYLYTPEIAEYRLYPRALAVAEVGWSEVERKDFEDFARRINNAYVRMDSYGINYHIPLPEQSVASTNKEAFVDDVTLEFTTTRPVKMVYTIDGSDPTPSSPEYAGESLTFTQSTTLKICSVLPSGKMSTIREIAIEKQSYRAPAEVGDVVEGLKMTTIPGYYLSRDEAFNAMAKGIDTPSVGINERYITSTKQMVKSIGTPKLQSPQETNIAEGYLEIAEDGVYHFSSNSEVWIGGELLVDNDGEVKRFSRNGSSVALAKGLHPIKIMWLGNIIGGWPSNWDSGAVTMRKSGDEKGVAITPEMLFREM